MRVKDGKIIQEMGEKYKQTLERYDDRTDVKWHHPDLRDTLAVDSNHIYPLNDPEISREERVKRNEKWEEDTLAMMPPLSEDTVTRESYVIKGLNEGDPDLKVYIIKPKKAKKKMRVLFGIGEGAMISNRYETYSFIYDYLADHWNCAVVFAEARSAIHAYYPAPLDDYQAAYEWMLANGEELGLNTNNVVLYGESGGGYTVVAFAFRCKRLGFNPKGCMACEPILADMMVYPSSKIVTGNWDAVDVHRTFHMCTREADQFSPFVGPEVIPARATVEDCVGLCPMYLHVMEMDSDRDPAMAFAAKLYEAKVFTQIHVWGGSSHAGLLNAPEDSEIKKAYEAVRDAEAHDMFKYDLRRPWTVEE